MLRLQPVVASVSFGAAFGRAGLGLESRGFARRALAGTGVTWSACAIAFEPARTAVRVMAPSAR